MPMAWHFLFGESDEHADRIQQIVKKEYNSWIDSIGTGGIITVSYTHLTLPTK